MNLILDKYLIAFFVLALAIPVTQTRVVATSSVSTIQKNSDSERLIKQAQQLYQDEQYVEASRVWQQAVTDYQQQGDILNQAMALSNLALTQQKLGDLTAAQGAIASSLKLLRNTKSQTETQQRIFANSLDIRGSIERSQGKSEKAFDTWREAAETYQELENNSAIIKNHLNQAQVLQDLGYYGRASKILKSVQEQLADQPISEQKASRLLSLGNTLRATGDLEQSEEVLKQARETADKLKTEHQQSRVLLSLGNTIRALGNRVSQSPTIQTVNLSSPQCIADSNLGNQNAYYAQAADCYQQAAALSPDPSTKIKAQLNLLSLAVQNQDRKVIDSPGQSSIFELITQIKTDLAQLPVTRTSIFDRLNLVQSLICLQPKTIELSSPIAQQCPESTKNNLNISWGEIESEINIARQQANQLQDKQAQVHALGYLGAIYQQTGRLTPAQQLTEQALLTMDRATAPETAYLWEWQLGRLYQLQNQPEKALQAYNTTFATLQSLRQNLVAINPEIQFAFRDRLEPVYRERAALLLNNNNPSQKNLRQARDTIEALQLAELNNFFREACLDAKPQTIEDVDGEAAVIYSIIFEDRLAVILSQPGKDLKYYETDSGLREIERVFTKLNEKLVPVLSSDARLKPHQTFYDWLIRPLESQLEQNGTKNLVFILDGIMRGIPVAALHDGDQYLVEKYNLALTPGLQLLKSPSLTSHTLDTISAGLTKERQGYEKLPYVQKEVTEIGTLVPSKILLDQNFTRDRLRMQITALPYPIVHLATHGEFSSRAEETFLLTWNNRIDVKDLDELLQERNFTENNPIELLILSACQTADGDNAALGLAGVAVRSGARSTVATLWSVRDDSTAELITQFYKALKTPGISKSKALRQAQLKLLENPKYQHPYFWSAFVLVGNWL